MNFRKYQFKVTSLLYVKEVKLQNINTILITMQSALLPYFLLKKCIHIFSWSINGYIGVVGVAQSFLLRALYRKPLDEKLDLHKICSRKICKSGAKMVNATLAYLFKTSCIIVCKFGIYHLCPWVTAKFIHFCDTFAMRKFASPFFSS